MISSYAGSWPMRPWKPHLTIHLLVLSYFLPTRLSHTVTPRKHTEIQAAEQQVQDTSKDAEKPNQQKRTNRVERSSQHQLGSALQSC